MALPRGLGEAVLAGFQAHQSIKGQEREDKRFAMQEQAQADKIAKAEQTAKEQETRRVLLRSERMSGKRPEVVAAMLQEDINIGELLGRNMDQSNLALATIRGGNPDAISEQQANVEKMAGMSRELRARENPGKISERARRAKEGGLIEGTPEYNRFVLKDSGGQTIKIGGEQSAFEKGVGMAHATEFAGYTTDANKARVEVADLEEIASIDLSQGPTAEIRAKFAALAIELGQPELAKKIGSATETQAFNSLANKLALGRGADMKGSMSENDVVFLKSQVPKIGNTAMANKFITNASIAAGKRKIAKEEFFLRARQNKEDFVTTKLKWNQFVKNTPIVSKLVKDADSGLPIFFHEFEAKMQAGVEAENQAARASGGVVRAPLTRGELLDKWQNFDTQATLDLRKRRQGEMVPPQAPPVAPPAPPRQAALPQQGQPQAALQPQFGQPGQGLGVQVDPNQFIG